MPGSFLLWLSWVVTLAAFLVNHVALLVSVLRARELSLTWRLLALIPVVTPVAGWRAKKTRRVVAWTLLAALYLVLRVLERFV